MSDEEEVRSGGASRKIMLLVGINGLRWLMIVDCICFVWFGVRAGLYFVCRASFVSMLMTMMSVRLNVVCLMVLSVCWRVNVMCGLILYLVLPLLMLLMAFLSSSAERCLRLLS